MWYCEEVLPGCTVKQSVWLCSAVMLGIAVAINFRIPRALATNLKSILLLLFTCNCNSYCYIVVHGYAS